MLTDIQRKVLDNESLMDIPLLYIVRVLVAVEEAKDEYNVTERPKSCGNS